ncbi:cation:proton antiporter, partial [bacterium]
MPHSPADNLAHIASLFIELGAVVIGLSILARLALKIGLTPIPFYLVAGVCFGAGGLHALPVAEDFIGTAAEIGVILLLFMLGLEYTGEELSVGLRRGFKSGIVDAVLNFLPGLICGFILGWKPIGAILLGGVTWISSSSIIAKVLGDLDRLGNRETSSILSILVLEDLAMAIYLPLVAVLLLGLGFIQGAVSIGIALFTVGMVLLLAIRFGDKLSRIIAHTSAEVVLLSIFGLILIVAGIAQKLQVSAAIGAFLRKEFSLKNLGVVLTDSHSSPLRLGVTGLSLAHWGIRGTQSLVGAPDIFGKELKFTSVNVVDSLATMAVFTMGEA